MSRITNKAEECKVTPTANTNVALIESPSRSAFNSSVKTKPHGFSKKLAQRRNSEGEQLGDTASILLRYLSYRQRVHGAEVQGKKRVRINLDQLSAKYSYIGRSTLDENIIRLNQFGCCEYENLNRAFGRPKYDRTRCYHIPKKWMDEAEEEVRYFDPTVASKVGVPAAVIYFNFKHWISESEKAGATKIVKLMPSTLVKLLPYSKSTIKRAIKRILSEGLIQAVPGLSCIYAPVAPNQAGSEADEMSSKADKGGSKADEGGSEADNDICYSYVVDSLETCSKEKPAASSLQLRSFEREKTSKLVHSPQAAVANSCDNRPPVYPLQNVIDCSEIQTGDGEGAFRWPTITTLEELHRINRTNASTVETFNKEASDRFFDAVRHMASTTLNEVSGEASEGLYANPNGDEVIKVVQPILHSLLDESTCNPAEDMFNIIYHAALECIVGAYLWPRDCKNSYSHPMHSLISLTHKLFIVLWRRAEDEREALVQQEFEERRIEFASVDVDLEDDDTLAPAQKARVFRNALNARNQVGWIFYDQNHRLDQITGIGSKAMKLLTKLFEHNEHLSPSDLLMIMDGCMAAYVKQPAPARLENYQDWYDAASQSWHARVGHDLMFFVTNLHHIVDQLGMRSSCPVETFLRDAKKDQPAVALAA